MLTVTTEEKTVGFVSIKNLDEVGASLLAHTIQHYSISIIQEEEHVDDSITLDELLDLIIKRVKPLAQSDASAFRLSAITGARPNEARMLDIESLEIYTSLSRTCIYKLIRQSDFPRGIPLTNRRVGWDIHEIDRWIENRRQQQSYPEVPLPEQST